MDKRPALFISHGAPTLAIEPSPTRAFLADLGASLLTGAARPRAILAATAHWLTERPTLSAAVAPTTIHDFGGFPAALYRLRYAAPGQPALAAEAAALLRGAGFDADLDGARGFDHGTWVPLWVMAPDAIIPVVQLSIQPDAGPAHALAVGRALRTLRDDGVLILASGAATHSLGDYFTTPPGAAEPLWVGGFAEWLRQAVESGDQEKLLAYRAEAPSAARHHPTEEHLLPLYVALGAGTPGIAGRRIHAATDNAVLRMDAYRFD